MRHKLINVIENVLTCLFIIVIKNEDVAIMSIDALSA